LSEIELPIRTFAAIWDVDERTVRNWTKDGCPKSGGRGTGRPVRYTEAAILWVYDNQNLRKRKSNGRKETPLDVARARKASRQGDILDLELAEKRGTLIQRSVAVDLLEKICGELRSQLLTIPNKWSPQLAKLTRRQVQVELRKAVDEALECLSVGEAIPEHDSDSGPPK
jgi:phage terminase Nu1 subunit (DNA packaging protein)